MIDFEQIWSLPALSVRLSCSRDGLGHVRFGTGARTIVFLHEWLADHRSFAMLLPYLDPIEFTYVFADLPGYGLSQELAAVHSVEQASFEVLRLMSGLGRPEFGLVGHSMSGRLAQYLALKAPDRVAGLLLISPVPIEGISDQGAIDGLTSAAGDESAARRAISARTGNRYTEAWIDAKINLMRKAVSSRTLVEYISLLARQEAPRLGGRSGVPVLALCGVHDVPMYRPEAVRENLATVFENAHEICVSAEAGHYSNLETPILTASLVHRFFAAVN